MKRQLLTGLTLLVLSASASGQVFKCVDGQGRVTFSQVPCAGQENESVDVKIDKSRPHAPQASTPLSREFDRAKEGIRNARSAPRQAKVARTDCKTFNDTALRTMIVKRQVVSGMTKADALRAWGKPERINGDQHVYHWPEASGYFYVGEEGCVTHVQGTFRGK